MTTSLFTESGNVEYSAGVVQSRNYDRHDYFAEKLAALDTLYRLLSRHPAAVVSLKKRPAR